MPTRALKIDPNLARAWTARAWATIHLYYFDFSLDAAPLVAEADAGSLRAVTFDARDATGWVYRSVALRIQGNLAAAFAATIAERRSIPPDPPRSTCRGWNHIYAG